MIKDTLIKGGGGNVTKIYFLQEQLSNDMNGIWRRFKGKDGGLKWWDFSISVSFIDMSLKNRHFYQYKYYII